MKRNVFFTLTIICLVVGLGLSSCGKKKEAGPEIGEELIAKLNNNSVGLTLTVEKNNISVEHGEKNGYRVTLKNPALNLDLSSFKELNIQLDAEKPNIPMGAQEMVFLYVPGGEYLEMLSTKGFHMEMNFSEFAGETHEKKVDMALKLNIGEMAIKGYDMTPLLDTASKKQTALDVLADFMNRNSSAESSAADIRYELKVTREDGKKYSVFFEMANVEGTQSIQPEFFIPLYAQKDQFPDFNRLLEQGKPLFNFDARCAGVKCTVNKDEKLLGSGTLADCSIKYYLEPDSEKSSFDYGMDWDLKGLKLTVPGQKTIELAGDIREWGMKFTVKKLKIPLIKAYFQVLKGSMEVSNIEDESERKKAQQQTMANVLKIGAELVKSKPEIRFSLSPFKHYFGEMSGEGMFQLAGLDAPPVGKASATVLDVDGILGKLRAGNVFPPESMEKISAAVKSILKIDESGNGTVTFEISPDQPGQYLLNGNPVKF
jgi:hypothetical protein